MNVDTASRADLEVAILEDDLEYLFGGLKNIPSMSTQAIREILVNYIVENNEAE